MTVMNNSEKYVKGGDNYRRLFESLDEGVIFFDGSGKIIEANDAARKILGLDANQLKGSKSFSPEWQTINLDGSPFPIEEYPVQIALKTGKAVKKVTMGIFSPTFKDYKWILVNSLPICQSPGEAPDMVTVFFSDITDQIRFQQKLEEETKLHQTLVEVSSSFINLSEKEIRQIIQINLERLGRFVEADRMYIFEYNWDTYTTSNTYEWCAEDIEPQIEYLQNYSMEGIEDWANSHKKGEPTYVEEVAKLDPEDQLRKTLEPQGIQSILSMPIMYQSQCLGFLGIDSVRKVHRYSEGELSILRIFSDILSNVQSRILIEKNEKERLKELRAISQVSSLGNDSGVSIFDLLSESVGLIQAGFFIPEDTAVQILWKNHSFVTEPFFETTKIISGKSELTAGEFLHLNVFIKENNRFLPEESDYIDTLLSTLKQAVNSRENLKKIQESQSRLQSLLNSQTNYIIRTDLRGLHTFWNRKFEEDFGHLYKSRGMEESDSLASLCDYDVSKAIDTVQKCLKEPGKSFQVELDKPKKDGSIMTTRWEFVCLTDSQGNAYEMQYEGLDISDIKKAEKELKESEKKYRFLFEEAPEGYLVIKDGVFVECNRTSEKMIRGTRKDLIGKQIFEVSPEYQPDGEPSQSKAHEILKSAQNNQVVKFEWLNKRLDGTEFLAEVKLSQIEMDGEAVLFATWKDITEARKMQKALEESEERFSQIAEHSGAVIWEADDKGLYTYISPVSKPVFGYEPEELVGKKYFYDLFPAEYSKEFKALGLAFLNSGKSLGNWENPIQRKDGKIIWVETFGTPIIDKNGVFKGCRGSDSDITDRKTAEEELLKFRTISDQATYGTVITKVENQEIIYCNQAFADMHGYTIEELIGQGIETLHTSDQLTNYYENILPLFLKDKEYSLAEFGRKRKDGSTFPGLVNVKQFTDNNGNPLYNAASVIDITERKKQEELISKQNERLQGILEAIPDGLFIVDREGNYLELLNTPKLEQKEVFFNTVGKKISEIFSEESSKKHLDQIAKALDTGGIVTYTYSGKMGLESYEFEARMVALSDNKVLRLVRDMTDQRKVEREVKKLTLAIEQSPVAVIITDLEGNLEYMSPAFLSMTGYAFEELIWKPIGIVKSGQTDKKTYQSLWKTIQSGKPWKNEWLNRRKDGTLFWEDILINPIRDKHGKITNYLAVKMDITQRKQYEEEILELNQNLETRIEDRTRELEKAKSEADEANKAKSEFLSRMSHELRTPMNSILGFAQLMEYTDLTAGQRRNVEFILKSGNHLLNLINEVLYISSIEAGKISIQPQALEVEGIIQEVTESLLPIAAQKGIKISFQYEVGSPKYVKADPHRLKQILFNLINNAIKYNNSNGSLNIQVLSEIIRVCDNTQMTRILVEDSGIGIEESVLEKLFNPFERGGLESSSIEGTGLGLSVVKKLVTLMDGEVGVKSKIGEGSTFWIDLPTFSQDPEKNTLNQNFIEIEKSHTTLKILLVEDNEMNIRLISGLVKNININHEIMVTKLGNEALTLAISHQPDLILLDLRLSDTNGKEVLKALKQNESTQSISVIIISADADPMLLEELTRLGAEHYITKPINFNELMQIITNHSTIKGHE